ncbi:hypothetical protein C8046_06655 [Serinibacter arcticus]|uniref:DUF3017 domain-containing protein n=1 Tax=Serinibacter arcticus TaxID=1655435 RepID=A0A2U1ZTR8_9MICO|nr:DUF3017 domain-containing protein [Serinibacter arcticus]PWD50377.1 hypothetical protein C8046_06655 [Serinibacter arcticus]
MERIKVNTVQLVALAGVVAAGLLTIASVRIGLQLLALVLLGLAVARAFGRPDRVLMARSRGFDVALLVLLGGLIAYLSFSPGL